MSEKIFAMVTDRIVELMEQGTVPWHKPWKVDVATGAAVEAPTNMVSGKAYRGVNRLLLGCVPYQSNIWMTYKQAQKAGGSVMKGEKGYPVVFWKFIKKEEIVNGEKREKSFAMLRYYKVFNLEQTKDVKLPKKFQPEDIEPDELPEVEEVLPIDCAESIIANMPNPPAIHIEKSNSAFYMSSSDAVTVPEISQYPVKEEYYCTLFHGLVHSTGHSSRLDRPEVGSSAFGSQSYSREELVAEIGAAMLCSQCDILDKTIDNSAAYIEGWSKQLKKNPRWIIIASNHAEKAARYILDIPEETNEDN